MSEPDELMKAHWLMARALAAQRVAVMFPELSANDQEIWTMQLVPHELSLLRTKFALEMERIKNLQIDMSIVRAAHNATQNNTLHSDTKPMKNFCLAREALLKQCAEAL